MTDQTIVQFGILDWDNCHERFGDRPAADAYDTERFQRRAIFYLTQGVYNMHHAIVEKGDAQSLCESVFFAQGNNPEGEKVVREERSLSIGDLVILGDGSVWLCAQADWLCLNKE